MSYSVPWSAKKGEQVTQLLLLPYTLPSKKELKKGELEDLEAPEKQTFF